MPVVRQNSVGIHREQSVVLKDSDGMVGVGSVDIASDAAPPFVERCFQDEARSSTSGVADRHRCAGRRGGTLTLLAAHSGDEDHRLQRSRRSARWMFRRSVDNLAYEGTPRPARVFWQLDTARRWQESLRAFSDVTFYAEQVFQLSTRDGAELLNGATVAPSFFSAVDGRSLPAVRSRRPTRQCRRL